MDATSGKEEIFTSKWKLFTAVGERPSTPFITITTLKNIIFNKRFCNNYKDFLKKYNHLRLYYCKKDNSIAMEFLESKDEEGAIKISQNQFGSKSISINSFLNFFSIDLTKVGKKRYTPVFKDIGRRKKFLTIDLNSPIPTTSAKGIPCLPNN
jgi:hypothetical protein